MITQVECQSNVRIGKWVPLLIYHHSAAAAYLKKKKKEKKTFKEPILSKC